MYCADCGPEYSSADPGRFNFILSYAYDHWHVAKDFPTVLIRVLDLKVAMNYENSAPLEAPRQFNLATFRDMFARQFQWGVIIRLGAACDVLPKSAPVRWSPSSPGLSEIARVRRISIFPAAERALGHCVSLVAITAQLSRSHEVSWA